MFEELRAVDVVSYFYYHKIVGELEGLVWDRITYIATRHCNNFGPGAKISVAGSGFVTYKHHQVDVYCYN